jgi:hypothetical protein
MNRYRNAHKRRRNTSIHIDKRNVLLFRMKEEPKALNTDMPSALDVLILLMILKQMYDRITIRMKILTICVKTAGILTANRESGKARIFIVINDTIAAMAMKTRRTENSFNFSRKRVPSYSFCIIEIS